MTNDNEYMVSVQWGKGFHYFVTPKCLQYIHAYADLHLHVQRLKDQRSRNKRGAKPIVRVWKLEEEEQLE